MVIVYTFSSAWDAVDLSPFVLKLLTWMRMTGVAHRAERGDIRKAPKRKLPYIDDGERLLGDSSLIIEHLLAKGVASPLAGDALSPVDAAIATAFKGMIECELYFVIVYSRWIHPHGFRTYSPVLKEAIARMGVPRLFTGLALWYLRRQMVRQLYQQGMGRHEPSVVLAKGKRQVDAIAAYLGDKAYFMGDEPATIDATVFAFVDSLTNTPLFPELTEHVERHDNLVRYRKRMRDRYWSA